MSGLTASQNQLISSTVGTKWPNVVVVEQTPEVLELHTIIRDKTTTREDFVFNSDRLIRLCIEEALGHLPYREKVITTPVGEAYNGLEVDGKICGVAMVPSGESMEIGLRTVCKSIRIGKILIQRTAGDEPKALFVKLPPDISERWVLLLDPMLATGKSALKALELITAQGVRPKNILFLNLIASVEGLSLFTQRFPDVKIITTHIDSSVDPITEVVLPGIGEFSNRYFGTD